MGKVRVCFTADLLFVNGNPLENLRLSARRHRGVLVDGQSREAAAWNGHHGRHPYPGPTRWLKSVDGDSGPEDGDETP